MAIVALEPDIYEKCSKEVDLPHLTCADHTMNAPYRVRIQAPPDVKIVSYSTRPGTLHCSLSSLPAQEKHYSSKDHHESLHDT